MTTVVWQNRIGSPSCERWTLCYVGLLWR